MQEDRREIHKRVILSIILLEKKRQIYEYKYLNNVSEIHLKSFLSNLIIWKWKAYQIFCVYRNFSFCFYDRLLKGIAM